MGLKSTSRRASATRNMPSIGFPSSHLPCFCGRRGEKKDNHELVSDACLCLSFQIFKVDTQVGEKREKEAVEENWNVGACRYLGNHIGVIGPSTSGCVHSSQEALVFPWKCSTYLPT